VYQNAKILSVCNTQCYIFVLQFDTLAVYFVAKCNNMVVMIGKKLKELRIEENLSQEKLAKELNIGRATLSQYETDKRQVPNELLPKIAKFFGVTIDYLFGLED